MLNIFSPQVSVVHENFFAHSNICKHSIEFPIKMKPLRTYRRFVLRNESHFEKIILIENSIER